MTVLTRWEPFRELTALQNRMNRLFEEQYGGGREESLTAGAFAPPVDIYEDEHSIQLKLEVPGIDEKDLDIRVENNVLTVSWRAQVREGREGRKLPSGGAPLRQLQPLVHVAEHGEHRGHSRRLHQRRVEDPAGQARRSQAEADQGQHRRPEAD